MAFLAALGSMLGSLASTAGAAGSAVGSAIGSGLGAAGQAVGNIFAGGAGGGGGGGAAGAGAAMGGGGGGPMKMLSSGPAGDILDGIGGGMQGVKNSITQGFADALKQQPQLGFDAQGNWSPRNVVNQQLGGDVWGSDGFDIKAAMQSAQQRAMARNKGQGLYQETGMRSTPYGTESAPIGRVPITSRPPRSATMQRLAGSPMGYQHYVTRGFQTGGSFRVPGPDTGEDDKLVTMPVRGGETIVALPPDLGSGVRPDTESPMLPGTTRETAYYDTLRRQYIDKPLPDKDLLRAGVAFLFGKPKGWIGSMEKQEQELIDARLRKLRSELMSRTPEVPLTDEERAFLNNVEQAWGRPPSSFIPHRDSYTRRYMRDGEYYAQDVRYNQDTGKYEYETPVKQDRMTPAQKEEIAARTRRLEWFDKARDEDLAAIAAMAEAGQGVGIFGGGETEGIPSWLQMGGSSAGRTPEEQVLMAMYEDILSDPSDKHNERRDKWFRVMGMIGSVKRQIDGDGDGDGDGKNYSGVPDLTKPVPGGSDFGGGVEEVMTSPAVSNLYRGMEHFGADPRGWMKENVQPVVRRGIDAMRSAQGLPKLADTTYGPPPPVFGPEPDIRGAQEAATAAGRKVREGLTAPITERLQYQQMVLANWKAMSPAERRKYGTFYDYTRAMMRE